MTIKNILFLSHEIPPIGGGAGRILLLLCRELHTRGYNIVIYTQKAPSTNLPQEKFPVRYFSALRTKIFETNILSLMVYIFKAIWVGMSEQSSKPDLIVSNMAIPAACAGAVLCKRFSCPHIIWHHGADVHFNRATGAPFWWQMIVRSLWRSANICCFVSPGMMNMAQSYGSMQQAAVLPIAPKLSSPDQVSSAENSLQPTPHHHYNFLFVGRYEPVKNPLFLLETWDKFHEDIENKNIHLRFIGGGCLKKTMIKFVQRYNLNECVTIDDASEPQVVAQAYAQATALVIPSIVEGFPTTILEAASFGVPAIGSKTCGVSDAIEDSKTGLLYEPGNCKDLFECMVRIVEDVELRNRLGKQAQNQAALYTINRTATVFIGLMDGLKEFV